MDQFREPEVEEVQLFLESIGTHGSIVDETALEIDCSTSTKVQARQSVLINLHESFPSIQ
ncbi:MAG: hypothetical protein QM426_02310 [Euryarchaeota archaeon]|nr:hypothetical protein [Euryarchaeota archaeon]